MRGSLGIRLFLYTGSTLVLMLLATLLIIERTQSLQWESHLREQSIAFAKFATPEVIKQFRGDFFAGTHVGEGEIQDFLGFNRQLIRFEIYSPSGRHLYRSPLLPDFIDLDLSDLLSDPDPERLATPRLTLQTTSSSNPRILDVVAPAFGPTGQHLLSVHYLISYDLIDQRLWELRRSFAGIAGVVVVVALILVALVARRITIPIRDLTEGVRAISSGDLSARTPQHWKNEIGTLAQAFNEMADSLGRSRQELTEKNRALTLANDELRQVQEQLLRAERLATLGQVAAGVSHEIDNPVGIILGYAELLHDDLPDQDPRRADVEAIIAECRRCRRITGGLLSLARTAPEERERIDVPELVQGIFRSLRPQMLFRNVEMSFEADDSVQPIVGDADCIRQILVNLFLNGAQAMSGAGQIKVAVSLEQNIVAITVCDSGPGIPADLQEKIFEPFFSTKGHEEGTGLGLSLCRKLAEEHGGRLELVTAKEGACFRLGLPSRPVE
ncbi:MAG: hypothetical protein C0616_04975 [Desulfuromonas sp.]|nr:MAG: hypothetical protein C0616_04975 [Desulfuromonas sp.]